MKKKGHHKKKGHRNKRRNDSGGGAAVASRARSRFPRIPRRGAPPPWHTLGAAVAGAVGGAVASGMLVNQKIADPETISMLMAVGGGVAAYLTDGNVRVAATGVACAGAGQYALVKLGKAALRKVEREQAAPAPAQLAAPAPPSSPEPPRQRASGGGVVLEMFRDASADYETSEEPDWRFATRDADVADDNATDDDTPLEIDLDEAA